MSDIVIQKSLKEGFGLTVTEAIWKVKPVIGGDAGGIRLQVINHHTGFLVKTPEGAALLIRYLLKHRERLHEIGQTAKAFVLENYLLTRHLREYLTLMLATLRNNHERIVLYPSGEPHLSISPRKNDVVQNRSFTADRTAIPT